MDHEYRDDQAEPDDGLIIRLNELADARRRLNTVDHDYKLVAEQRAKAQGVFDELATKVVRFLSPEPTTANDWDRGIR